MKIGKETIPRSAICTSNEDTISVRGLDLCQDVIGKLSFSDYFFLLLNGQRPTGTSLKIVDAALAAISEHGFVLSVQATSMTMRPFLRRFKAP